MKKCFLIINFSTRNVQADLIDIENGQLLDSRLSTYTWIHENPGWSEINLDDIWSSSQNVVKEIIEENKKKYDVAALGFSWFGDNLVITNKKGEPLDNLILSFDYRAKEEAQKLIDEFGEDKLFNLVGYEPVSAGLIPAKILWLKRHKKKIYTHDTLFLNLQQYILFKLGLGIVTDYSLACRKNMYDVKNLRWSDSLCDYLDIGIDQLGREVLPANTVIGSIKKFGEVDLPDNIPVLIGTHNSVGGMLGMGSLPHSAPILTEIVGTFDVIGYLTDSYFEKYTGFFACYNGPFRDSYIVAGSSIARTDLEWALRTLYQEDKVSTMTNMLQRCKLDGENSVIMAKSIQTGDGVIRGINLESTRDDILQAIVEGITYPLIGIINQFTKINNKKFTTIRFGGRGAEDARYLQLKADMYNLAVEKTKNNHASSLGAAILLAVELGFSPDYESAFQQMISVEKVYEPRKEIAQRYKQRYLEYLENV